MRQDSNVSLWDACDHYGMLLCVVSLELHSTLHSQCQWISHCLTSRSHRCWWAFKKIWHSWTVKHGRLCLPEKMKDAFFWIFLHSCKPVSWMFPWGCFIDVAMFFVSHSFSHTYQGSLKFSRSASIRCVSHSLSWSIEADWVRIIATLRERRRIT